MNKTIFIINTAFFTIVLIGIAIVSVKYSAKYEYMKAKYEELDKITGELLEIVKESLK